jgi:hypothetical protein
MEVTMDKITVFFRGDPTHPMNSDTARMTDYFAHHVLRHFIFVTADGRVASLTPVFTVKNLLVSFQSKIKSLKFFKIFENPR